MGRKDDLNKLRYYLQTKKIYILDECYKSIGQLVKSDFDDFANAILDAFTRKAFNRYNCFEKLHLSKKQRDRLEGNILWRWEYRKESNLRIIFIIDETPEASNIVLLHAFVENSNKSKGKDSYKKGIETAIENYTKNMKGVD